MNKIRKFIFEIFAISLCVIGIILMFLPIYTDIAILPFEDSQGNLMTQTNFYEITPFERLVDMKIQSVFYLALLLFAIGILTTIFPLKNKKKIKVEMHRMLMAFSIVLLIALLLLASVQVRMY